MVTIVKRPPIMDLVAKATGGTMRWGRVDCSVPHVATALNRFRATIFIYPPGTTRSQARWIVIRSAGTSWVGGLVGLFLIGATALLWPPAVIGVVGALVALWLVSVSATSKVYRAIRFVTMTVSPHGVTGDDRFEETAAALDDLDNAETDAVGYELRWGAVYARIGAEAN